MAHPSKTDAEQIQDVILRYNLCINRRDWAGIGAFFAENAVWEAPAVPGARFEGREQIAAQIPKLVGTTDILTQMNTPSLIAVEGDRATAQCTVRETGSIFAADTRFEAHGIYEDELVRRDGAWLFARRRFVVLENWHYPLPRRPATGDRRRGLTARSGAP